MISRSRHTLLFLRQTWLIPAICLASVVSGCSITGTGSDSETAERTLPEALDARRVSLADARHTVPAPDTVNVGAYVIKLAICPENANCLLSDGIIIAESLEPDDERTTRRIAVEKPRQFTEGSRYLISLGVTDPSDRNLDENLLDIIGYSGIK